MRILLSRIFHPEISRQALRVALVVGTVLTIINHYDLFFGKPLTAKVLIQIMLTYTVPYLVSTHGQLLGTVNRPAGDTD
ncbi:MAG: nitrate/nitrite transporter NrtS [Gammaproteobacteria bacterium]